MSAEELKVLNNLVSGYFDFAEVQAIKHRPMYMNDYIKHLDAILSSTGEVLLMDAGMISHEQAMDKAETEYRKWEVRTLSPVEQAYLNSIKTLNHKTKRRMTKKNETLYEQSFSDDYSEKKAIDAAHTAQATVQKAKHRVQEILD